MPVAILAPDTHTRTATQTALLFWKWGGEPPPRPRNSLDKSLVSLYFFRMGKLDLLQANYIGKVGQTYGVRQYRQSIVKATPFSHTPHNKTQKNSVRSFEKLNRFSAYVAKTFWRNLNLSDKKMYKHNAVATWLKPCVKNHRFQLENIAEVIKSNSSLRITDVSMDFAERTASITFENAPLNSLVTSEKIFVALVSDNGTVKGGGAFDPVGQTLNFSWDYTDFVSLSVVMFKSSVQQGKKIINGFCLYSQNADFVIDGILYTSLMPLSALPTIENGIIHFETADAEIADNILHFLNI